MIIYWKLLTCPQDVHPLVDFILLRLVSTKLKLEMRRSRIIILVIMASHLITYWRPNEGFFFYFNYLQISSLFFDYPFIIYLNLKWYFVALDGKVCIHTCIHACMHIYNKEYHRRRWRWEKNFYHKFLEANINYMCGFISKIVFLVRPRPFNFFAVTQMLIWI